MPGSKKDKKNARDSGGIAAAVTRQTAGKFSNASGTSVSSAYQARSDSASNASSPPLNTPEIRPSVPHNANLAPSPLLDALSAPSISASTPPSMTNEWARNVLAGSPGNVVSLMGESPPTQPSSYEDSGRLHQGWAAAHRPFASPAPASPSPPNSIRRPLSFQMEPHYQAPEALAHGSAAGYRRSSLHSQFNHARMGPHPPLPHHPQPHFYGTPDLDLTLTPKSGMKAGEQGHFFGFDTLPSALDSSSGSSDVVVAGYEGGLDVYAVSRRGLEPVGGLKGLRGGVRFAKILPWTAHGDKEALFPLVAVVLHGPVLPQSPPEVTIQDGVASPRPDGAASPRSAFSQPDGRPTSIEFYQTSVQVYSLRTNKLVDVLLEAPKIPISSAISLTSPVFQPPPPSGAFSIKADGGTIAVCSGITGECWAYLQLLETQNSHIFTCVGKLWTSLQHSYRGDVAEEGDSTYLPVGPSPQIPIFALHGRWIAYCPSSPSSHITLRAYVPVPILGRGPGIATVTPPNLPPIVTSVDQLVADSVVNKIMRETTQELIQGAKWVGQQGLQAWNSYWNKSPNPQSPPQHARSPPQHWPGTMSPHGDSSQFPPTHGSPGQAMPKDPGLVSILDAEALATSPSIHPLATFTAPLGCSFLSFSPTSLALFTASSKGDVQTVWDLLRIQHTRSSPLQAATASNDSSGPLVRQVAQFSRMTVARIVDVAWTGPHGERIAMVTERGTVHLLDMPYSVFTWPPPRRRRPVQEGGGESSEQPASAVAIASGAFGAAYQAAKPFVTRSRGSSASNPPPASSTFFKDSAAHGGRVIAASISSSLGKTGTAINQLRHTGENRVTLPLSAVTPGSSCVAWIRTRKSHVLFSLGDGLVRSFPYKSRRPSTQAGRRRSGASGYKDLKVPLLPSDVVPAAVKQILELGAQEEYLDFPDRELDGGNTMTLNPRPRVASQDHSVDAAIPQAEIESSAPYQPFHTDRRITLCEYAKPTTAQTDGVSSLLADVSLEPLPSKKQRKALQRPRAEEASAGAAVSAWSFGGPISTVKVDLGLLPTADEETGGPEDHRALPPDAMERVMQYGDEEQIVVTTRKRRGARKADPDEDGFFEDDCEVLDFADQRV